MTHRVIVIGLDGATFDLIRPWAAEGHLPTLARLMDEGSWGELRSTMPPMTAPAWTSFATGVNPGKHRLYDWIARDDGGYAFAPLTARDATAPTLYRLLSEAGRRVLVMNVPMSYPAAPVNGIMIAGMPAPTLDERISHPPGIVDELKAAIGDYILYPDPGQAYSDRGIDSFLQRLYRTTELRTAAFRHLLAQERWDFAMLVYNGTDTISHALWKFMDQRHPLHDPRRYTKYGHAIRDYYRFVDGQLAALMDTLDDQTTLLLMSDHGFGPFHKFIHVNNWLMAEGWLHAKRGLMAQLKQRLFRRGMAPMSVYNQLMRVGLGALKREVVRGQGQGLMKRLFFSFEDVDWSRTVAYSLGNVGQIYLNVAGREPQGCVQPGAQYEALRDEIMARLLTLRDPDSGEAVVEAVYRREALFSGDQLALAPDILFMPTRLEYFGFGEYEFGSHKIIEPMARGISGTHRMNGIFLAHGPAIQKGHVDGASLLDLAPTILHLLGQTPSAAMDGRLLDEIIAPDFRPAPAAPHKPWADHDGPRDDNAMSEEEQRIIAERLRSLGYVG
ncbi:MAG: alkaline phosphatase family protein [Anaerolineales bacterium]|nr:alkaline phosphatase family protein [Anaerolineales bacterium]MCB9126373.1 alkaline phosphatase family protein [Ardenticatenales bacterium]MCB9171534.1 alkaline phosphatase family protein [Ardenticatenales bacterium]